MLIGNNRGAGGILGGGGLGAGMVGGGLLMRALMARRKRRMQQQQQAQGGQGCGSPGGCGGGAPAGGGCGGGGSPCGGGGGSPCGGGGGCGNQCSNCCNQGRDMTRGRGTGVANVINPNPPSNNNANTPPKVDPNQDAAKTDKPKQPDAMLTPEEQRRADPLSDKLPGREPDRLAMAEPPGGLGATAPMSAAPAISAAPAMPAMATV